jgi:hypothetical protein
MQWLIQKFNALRIQIIDKPEKDFVRQFGIAANAYGGFTSIGQHILNEQVRRADTEQPLLFLQAVNLAERFASQEIEVLRTEGRPIRGGLEASQGQKTEKVCQMK